MGNRALIVFKDQQQVSPAIYLHWNGGPESVYAFLDALDRYEMRADVEYEAARFVQLVGNFFGGTLSLGIRGVRDLEDLEQLDCDDNGVYVVQRSGVTGQHPFGVLGERQVRRRRSERWLSQAEVEAERVKAYRHPYHVGEKPIALAIDAANGRHFVAEAGR